MPRAASPSARRLLAAVAATAAGALALAPTAPAAPAGQDVVVVLHDRVRPAAATSALEHAHGFRADAEFAAAVPGFAARLSPGQRRRLLADPAVAHVTPDITFTATAKPPPKRTEVVPPGIDRIRATNATRADVGVAVVDTGLDLANPDLNARSGTNCVRPGSPAHDGHGHGTHVGGTIAARRDGAGAVGVAPDTTLHAVKVLDRKMSGSLSQVLCGLDWVARNAAALNIRVVNMSIGGAGHSDGACGRRSGDPLHAAICALTAAGVTVVAAAGNSASDLAGAIPAAYPEVLTVTAMTDTDGVPGGRGPAPCARNELDDRASSFSNFATTATHAAHVVAAPGTCIVSTARGGGTTTMSGTSMAAPHVAGTVALCHGSDGTRGPCARLTPARIVQRVRSDAEAATAAGFGFTGDPLRPLGGTTFGHLASAADH